MQLQNLIVSAPIALAEDERRDRAGPAHRDERRPLAAGPRLSPPEPPSSCSRSTPPFRHSCSAASSGTRALWTQWPEESHRIGVDAKNGLPRQTRSGDEGGASRRGAR